MSETQDEEQWLYGEDEKEETINDENESLLKKGELLEGTQLNGNIEEHETSEKIDEEEKNNNSEKVETERSETEEKETDKTQSEAGDDKDKNGDADDNSSSDDEPTVTIGKIVKQPDIIKPPPPTHRAAATTGLKDEDFDAIGKVNGIPVTEFNLTELEEKPWRKPGADLSDYFNYGFNEDTWIRYCERQRTMRLQESGVGLGGLGGIPKLSGSSNIPVSIVNDNSKYGGFHSFKIAGKAETEKTQGEAINTIQVMTAEKRAYSSKVLSGSFENDFSGPPPYGDFYRPPPPFYSGPPPTFENPSWVSVPNVPPPGWTPDSTSAPQPEVAFYDEGKSNSHGGYRERGRDRDLERDRSRERSRERDDRDRRRSRERESRHKRRSRSQSRPKHRKRSRSHSRSRSPGHRHKRKKSKRDKDEDSGRD